MCAVRRLFRKRCLHCNI